MARVWRGLACANTAKTQMSTMLTLLLTLAGLFCFWLFFLAADYFEKI